MFSSTFEDCPLARRLSSRGCLLGLTLRSRCQPLLALRCAWRAPQSLQVLVVVEARPHSLGRSRRLLSTSSLVARLAGWLESCITVWQSPALVSSCTSCESRRLPVALRAHPLPDPASRRLLSRASHFRSLALLFPHPYTPSRDAFDHVRSTGRQAARLPLRQQRPA
ncbi:hypothetical protein BJY59DRAFT_147862 [Rhodotorula toruloides]